MKKILPLFSFIFHPIFIPILGTLLYVKHSENYFAKDHFLLLLLQVVIITFLLPLSFFYLFKTIGKVDTIVLSDVSQRKISLLLQLVLTIVLLQKSVTIDRFFELYFFFLSGLISILIAFTLLFFKVKVSIHMLGISTLTFFVIGISLQNSLNLNLLIAILFLVTGLIASSQLQFKAHSINELILGYCFGMLPQIGFWWFWL